MSEATTRRPWWRRWFGSRSERAAAKYLRRLGWRIVARNFTCSTGELDLVAMDGSVIVFVEVRSTETADPLRPAESVDLAKQKKVSAAALAFLKKHRLLGRDARFDVLAISWPANRPEPEIVHFPNAFESVGRFQLFS